MKLWQSKSTQTEAIIEHFTIGRDQELDIFLAKYDIQGSLAHIYMLHQVGLLEKEAYIALAAALKRLYPKAVAGQISIESGIEDIHSQIEFLLTKELGEAGKKIHTGRSRNDQVLVDLRLFFREEIREITSLTEDLFDVLLNLANQYRSYLMPGYTHLQVGMVSSFGLWFSAFAESLVDDLNMLLAAYNTINQNPLGSAAGYGSSFPLDRKLTTDLLGFRDLCYNSIHAQLGRGKSELSLAFGMASIAHTLGKMAMDICLFSNQNYSFLELPQEMTTGSSIMPHKKNPDVFELIRGRCNQVLTLPQQIISMTNNLPSGYHRDFQLLKEVVFPGLEPLKTSLQLTAYALPKIKVRDHLLDDPKYLYVYTVDALNEKVMKGMPFRDAYREIAEQIQENAFEKPGALSYTHEGSIGNLCLEDIQRKKDLVVEAFEFDKAFQKIEALLK